MSSDDDRPIYEYHRHREQQYNLNNKIMLTAIICLFFVVIVVLLLHIYARCVLKRQARRRAALRQLGVGITAAGVHSTEPTRTGLDPSVISSLPIFIYKQMIDQRLVDSTAIIECSVCLSTLEEEEMARLLPNCKHTFHAQCIDMWLNAHSTCPICRTDAEPRPQPPHQEAVPMASAPPLDSSMNCSEGTSSSSDGVLAQSSKVSGSSSRLSSFRRMLSREKSERRIQPCETEDGVGDVERQ